jgi:hypothetical protein
MTLIKDLTEDYDGEFWMKAVKGLRMIEYRRTRIANIRERVQIHRDRIDRLQAEIEEIGKMDVEDLVL